MEERKIKVLEVLSSSTPKAKKHLNTETQSSVVGRTTVTPFTCFISNNDHEIVIIIISYAAEIPPKQCKEKIPSKTVQSCYSINEVFLNLFSLLQPFKKLVLVFISVNIPWEIYLP